MRIAVLVYDETDAIVFRHAIKIEDAAVTEKAVRRCFDYALDAVLYRLRKLGGLA